MCWTAISSARDDRRCLHRAPEHRVPDDAHDLHVGNEQPRRAPAFARAHLVRVSKAPLIEPKSLIAISMQLE